MKQLRRQMKFVGMILNGARQEVSDKETTLVSAKKQCSLPIIQVKELISQGVLCPSGQTLSRTNETRSWLKRQQLALLKQDVSSVQVTDQKPVKSANDTIVRLSRKSKGEEQAFLAAHHVLVANRVSALIEKGQLRQSITQNLSVLRQSSQFLGNGATDLSDMAIDCRKRLNQLITQLPKDCAGVVVDICGYDKGLQQVEFERSWPRRSAKLVLRMGLDHAAEFWKIGATAEGQDCLRK
ncbi:DUF6456 domain-containing protein [Maritalea porphyrae]|uniref:DUF6456 domain-containing protein n=1 Tax=Maritalea porphyrae TaxID=880732 RepID=UPI0022AE554A|nr:DUF6456 domain-containing protein [Maritalea porphyrae]MCZ4271177.1 DUF6456 domain-containing protein [Maritalea porphyrae]